MEGDDEIRGLPCEYVLQIDGKVKSAYRRFVDALRAGLELKQIDVAPNFYPAAIGVWRSVLSSWAGVAAVRGAEPSVERSAADRRCAA